MKKKTITDKECREILDDTMTALQMMIDSDKAGIQNLKSTDYLQYIGAIASYNALNNLKSYMAGRMKKFRLSLD